VPPPDYAIYSSMLLAYDVSTRDVTESYLMSYGLLKSKKKRRGNGIEGEEHRQDHQGGKNHTPLSSISLCTDLSLSPSCGYLVSYFCDFSYFLSGSWISCFILIHVYYNSHSCSLRSPYGKTREGLSCSRYVSHIAKHGIAIRSLHSEPYLVVYIMRPLNQPLRDVTAVISVATLSPLHPLTVPFIISIGRAIQRSCDQSGRELLRGGHCS
jgi:hypothetical protein